MTATAQGEGGAAAAQATLPADPGGARTTTAPEQAEDTYSAAEAGRVLGISERRVRQLVGDGKLPGQTVNNGPLRLPKEAVHRERTRRRRQPGLRAAGAPGGPQLLAPAEVDVEDLVQQLVKAAFPLMLEPAQRAEQAAREAHLEERALRLAAEARVVDLQVRAELAEQRLRDREGEQEPASVTPEPLRPAEPPRRWWRKSGS